MARRGRIVLGTTLGALAAGAATLALLTGVPGASAATSCAGAGTMPTDGNVDQIEMATVCLVNEERRSRGLPALRLDERLDEAARVHSADMRSRGYFSHTSPGGTTPSDRAKAAGYPAGAGENILQGRVTPAQAVALWMDSPPHRANILDKRYKGIGAAYAGGYWTHTFGFSRPPAGSPTGLAADSGGGGSDGGSGGGDGGSGGGGAAGAAGGVGGALGTATGAFPAKLEVLRAGVRGGRLDMLAEITARANGDSLQVTFIANGRRFSFTERVSGGRVRVSRRLPSQQRGVSSGILEIAYRGNERVRPAQVRLRAASRRASLRRTLLAVQDGVLTAQGTVSSAARGVVRLELAYQAPDGTLGTFGVNAPIAGGRWAVERALPPAAAGGGYLTIQFTGYLPRRMRGEQIAKQVLAGQRFGG